MMLVLVLGDRCLWRGECSLSSGDAGLRVSGFLRFCPLWRG